MDIHNFIIFSILKDCRICENYEDLVYIILNDSSLKNFGGLKIIFASSNKSKLFKHHIFVIKYRILKLEKKLINNGNTNCQIYKNKNKNVAFTIFRHFVSREKCGADCLAHQLGGLERADNNSKITNSKPPIATRGIHGSINFKEKKFIL